MVTIPRWQVIFILAIVVLGIVFALPNVFSRDFTESLPDWVPNQQMALGLDLQGGSHLLLEVQADVVIGEELETITDQLRTRLRQERIFYTGLGVVGSAVQFRVRDVADIERAQAVIDELTSHLAESGFVANLVSSIGPVQAAGVEVDSSSDGTFRLSLTEEMIADRKDRAINQSVEVVRRRIDALGTREPTIQRQGEERILVQVPGFDDPEELKRILGTSAKMTFHLVDESVPLHEALQGQVPPGAKLMPLEDSNAGGGPSQILVRNSVQVSGDRLVDAQPTVDQTGRPVVQFRFDTVGARQFGETTQQNVGNRLAIVLDGKVISAPQIREPILGGTGVISGSFTVQTAGDLALLLRAGALPAPVTILEERTVGPGLGADSIAAGQVAAIIGLALVIVFMGLAYGLFGVLADIALMANIILIAGALSLLQATLTLPGIAGIVLTIGMAVDANVLIFERIREELRGGRSPLNAVDAGYRRALTTIIDSNVTTLIAAVLLFQFGSGPIRGFAVTLSIGLLTSMFTAIMVTRLMVVTWLRRRRLTTLEI